MDRSRPDSAWTSWMPAPPRLELRTHHNQVHKWHFSQICGADLHPSHLILGLKQLDALLRWNKGGNICEKLKQDLGRNPHRHFYHVIKIRAEFLVFWFLGVWKRIHDVLVFKLFPEPLPQWWITSVWIKTLINIYFIVRDSWNEET